MSEGRSTILVRVFGQDAPGITAGLMDVLSAGHCELYDVEQVVIRDRLSLNVLISVPDDQTTIRDVLFYATERRLTADFEPVADVPAPSRNRFAVSVIGARVTPQAFGAISRAIAEAGGNIDSIERLSRYPVVSYELAVSGGDHNAMRTSLLFVRTLKRMGMKVGILSGGFTWFTDRLASDLGLDHSYANELEIEDGRLTGRITGTMIDRARKAEILREIAAREGIGLDQVVAIGDGANDLDMLAAAGLGIGFNAKPVVRNAADSSVSVPYLDAILFVLGIRRDEVEADVAGNGSPPEIVGLPPI
ncbi:MAG: HAD-IB family phosphatase [Actinobacteria bacterium]|nr:HAD-IB family phosphatase [Actinomycetota bacterium]